MELEIQIIWAWKVMKLNWSWKVMENTANGCHIFDQHTCFLAFILYHCLLSDLVRSVV